VTKGRNAGAGRPARGGGFELPGRAVNRKGEPAQPLEATADLWSREEVEVPPPESTRPAVASVRPTHVEESVQRQALVPARGASRFHLRDLLLQRIDALGVGRRPCSAAEQDSGESAGYAGEFSGSAHCSTPRRECRADRRTTRARCGSCRRAPPARS